MVSRFGIWISRVQSFRSQRGASNQSSAVKGKMVHARAAFQVPGLFGKCQ